MFGALVCRKRGLGNVITRYKAIRDTEAMLAFSKNEGIAIGEARVAAKIKELEETIAEYKKGCKNAQRSEFQLFNGLSGKC